MPAWPARKTLHALMREKPLSYPWANSWLKDGFSAFVHYHRFDRAKLRKLTYTVLGDWIARAKAEKNALRVEKARELQQMLEPRVFRQIDHALGLVVMRLELVFVESLLEQLLVHLREAIVGVPKEDQSEHRLAVRAELRFDDRRRWGRMRVGSGMRMFRRCRRVTPTRAGTHGDSGKVAQC